MIGTTVAVIAGVLFILAALNWRAFARLVGVGRSQVNKLADAAENTDRVGLLRQKIKDETQKLSEAQNHLANQKALVLGSQRRIEQVEKEIAELDGRIKFALREGNEPRAAEYVSQLSKAKAQLLTLNEDRTRQENSYTDFKNKCEVFQKNIRDAMGKVEHLGNTLESSQQEARMAELNKNFTNIGDGFDDISRHTNEIQKQIDLNRAKAQASSDMNAGALELEGERERMQAESSRLLLEEYKKTAALPAPEKV